MMKSGQSRVEKQFIKAKHEGKAVFISFVTAGYPTSNGKFPEMDQLLFVRC